MGCTTAKNQSIEDNFTPPRPKEEIDTVINMAPAFKELRGSLSISSTATASTTASASGDEGVLGEHAHVHAHAHAHDTWKVRRNSQKEKDHYIKRKTKEARIELGKRITHRNSVSVKCPKCGDPGPESCNNYYGYYLLVREIKINVKCRRCGVNFSYEHIGVVKTVDETITEIMNEATE